MDIIPYEYNGKTVEFFLGEEIMINATEMASVFGKRTVDFTVLVSTKKMIEAMKKKTFSTKKGEESSPHFAEIKGFDVKNLVTSEDGTPILLTIPIKEHGGTWMHRWLAIDFAMWLDIDFKIWVLEKIDMLFESYGRKQKHIAIRTNLLKAEKTKIIEDNLNDEAVKRIAQIDEELRKLNNEKALNTRNLFNQKDN